MERMDRMVRIDDYQPSERLDNQKKAFARKFYKAYIIVESVYLLCIGLLLVALIILL